jgi:hypothetical protein
MKATRIAYSQGLTQTKYAALEEQARRLGRVRSEVWQRYGSVAGIGVDHRTIRDAWIAEGRDFGVLANAWKETLRDAKANIELSMESAKVQARRAVRRHTQDEQERRRLDTLLKKDEWPSDPYLSRIMRKYWKRGHNHVGNQIIVRSDNVTTFQRGGKAWVSIPSLVPRKKIAIPLNTTVEPKGTLRVILREGRVEVHYAIEVEETTDCGADLIGVDKGYSEVFVDSDGQYHGTELGDMLRAKSDSLRVKNQRRAKLRARAKNTTNERKRQNIIHNNLGRKKSCRLVPARPN